MPYYSWTGINLLGETTKGKSFASSIKSLQSDLESKEIGLIQAKPARFILFLPDAETKINFISNLSMLLKSNIQLYKALKITSTTNNGYLKLAIEDIAVQVNSGAALSKALANHGRIFDELTQSVVSSGEKTGDLAAALSVLADHNERMQKFRQHIRTTLTVPIITLSFLIAIILVIFLFVIPRFENFFASFNRPLPNSTKIILAISSVLRSWHVLVILPALIGIIYFCYFLFTKLVSKKSRDAIWLNMPVVANFYKVRFLQSMAMLLGSGVRVTDALDVVQNTVSNLAVKDDIDKILHSVQSGKKLSHAINQSKYFSSQEIEALISIGESTGKLSFMLSQGAEIFQKRMYSRINKLILLVQPILLIILGLIIAMLIFAVYVPMFTLSSVVQ